MPQNITTSTNGGGVLRIRLTCEVGDAGLVTFVELSGELDIATVPELESALNKIDPDSGPVVLDLRELEFMDCAGAHLLVDSDHRVGKAGQSLLPLVVADRGPIERILALLGLSHQLSIVKQPQQDRSNGRLGSDGSKPARLGR